MEVEEESVEESLWVVGHVDVGAQAHGGLGFTGRHEQPGLESAERVDAVEGPVGGQCSRGLGEDVVGELVAGMVQALVAVGVPGSKAGGGRRARGGGRLAFDRRTLGGDADPGVALGQVVNTGAPMSNPAVTFCQVTRTTPLNRAGRSGRTTYMRVR